MLAYRRSSSEAKYIGQLEAGVTPSHEFYYCSNVVSCLLMALLTAQVNLNGYPLNNT